MIQELRYRGDQETTVDALARGLQALVPVRATSIIRHRLTFLDTFHGQIAASGGQLATQADSGHTRLEWQARDRKHSHHARLTTPIAFAWDLPSGPLRESLKPIVAARRLLPQVEAELHGRALDVLDDERKTVAGFGSRRDARECPDLARRGVAFRRC